VARVLEKRGYSVLQAENGREALEIARADIDRISLVITDLVMPELGGGALVDELRALNPDVRVLCMTGYTKEEVLTGDGLDDAVFIEKPFAPSALLEQVELILN
jgi:CheY-like chemotaxis protein